MESTAILASKVNVAEEKFYGTIDEMEQGELFSTLDETLDSLSAEQANPLHPLNRPLLHLLHLLSLPGKSSPLNLNQWKVQDMVGVSSRKHVILLPLCIRDHSMNKAPCMQVLLAVRPGLISRDR